MNHVSVSPIINLNMKALEQIPALEYNTFIICVDFRPSFVVCGSHMLWFVPKRTTDPPPPPPPSPQLPGTLVSVPTARCRQRRGRVLRLRCSPPQLAFSSVWWWWLERKQAHSTPHKHTHGFHQIRTTKRTMTVVCSLPNFTLYSDILLMFWLVKLL